jgi:hypothetical protein
MVTEGGRRRVSERPKYDALESGAALADEE